MLSKERKIHRLFILSYSEITDKLSGSAWGSVYASGGLRGWCHDNEIIGDLVRDFGK